MTRGLRAAWPWRRAFWSRVSPGRAGFLAFALLPFLFFLPLEVVPVFGDQRRGITILLWLSSISLPLSIRGGASLRDEASIWPFQKGMSLGELALEDWILDLGLLTLSGFWWASLGALAVGGPGPWIVSLWAAFFCMALTTAALTHALTLSLSAIGVRRFSDLTILLALLSLLAPVLAIKAPEWTLDLVRLLLPPFRAAVEIQGAVQTREMEGAAGPLLHLLLFSGLVLWLGVRRISAWRPGA